MKEVKINAALNGFIVDVGCKKMVYTDISSVLRDLREYLGDWDKKEKEICETALNKRLLRCSTSSRASITTGTAAAFFSEPLQFQLPGSQNSIFVVRDK